MFPFSLFTCGADACDPAPPSASPLSLSPFLAIFILATTLAHTRLLPLLASLSPLEADDAVLPTHAPPALRAAHADHAKRSPRQRAAALTFSVTVGLAALLGVLIVCEVAEVLDPRARAAALGVAVPGLAVCLVLAVPWLVTMSAVVGAGRSLRGTDTGASRGLPGPCSSFSLPSGSSSSTPSAQAPKPPPPPTRRTA